MHQGSYVSAFLWWDLDGVLYAVQIPAQDLLVEVPDTVTVTHLFLYDRFKPIMSRDFGWGEDSVDPMYHPP